MSTTHAGSLRPACSHEVEYLLVISFSPLPNLIAKQLHQTPAYTAHLGVDFPVQKPFSHQEFSDMTFLKATRKEIGTFRIM